MSAERRRSLNSKGELHLLARRGSLPLLMVTEGLVAGGAPVAVTGGGAPFPGERPLGRPVGPNDESRVAPGGGLLLLLLLTKGCMVPLPGERGGTTHVSTTHHETISEPLGNAGGEISPLGMN